VLMDALRIFDEKVHSGEIQLSDEPLLENPLEQFEEVKELERPEESDLEEVLVSEDLLGLANLDKLERKKPYIFKGLEAFDPADIHRQVIDETLPDIPNKGKEKLVSFLSGISTTYLGDDGLSTPSKSQAVIIYTCDEFLQHAIMTVCKKEGILVFVTSEKHELDNLIERALFKYLEPILVFGSPVAETSGFSKNSLIEVRSLKMLQYPQISIIQLASPLDFSFSLQSLNDGVRAVFPMPYFLNGRKLLQRI